MNQGFAVFCMLEDVEYLRLAYFSDGLSISQGEARRCNGIIQVWTSESHHICMPNFAVGHPIIAFKRIIYNHSREILTTGYTLTMISEICDHIFPQQLFNTYGISASTNYN